MGEIDGSSLVPLLTGKASEFQRGNEGLLFHYPHYGQSPLHKPQSALMMGKYKILRDLENGADRLFDLESDLSEANDLAAKMPELAGRLGKALDLRLKQVGAQLPTANPNYDPKAVAPRGRMRGGRR